MKSPTERTLIALREDDWTVEVVEKWMDRLKIRKDLFGFIDVLALKGGTTLAVQCTSTSNVSSRVQKIAQHENLGAVREAGWQIQVWGWRRYAKKVDGKLWRPTIVDIS